MSSSHDSQHQGWLAAEIPPDESERLAALREYQILDTPPEQVFDQLTWLASFICQTPMALVTLIDRHRQWFKSRVGFDSVESPRSESICAHAVLKPDASENQRHALKILAALAVSQLELRIRRAVGD